MFRNTWKRSRTKGTSNWKCRFTPWWREREQHFVHNLKLLSMMGMVVLVKGEDWALVEGSGYTIGMFSIGYLLFWLYFNEKIRTFYKCFQYGLKRVQMTCKAHQNLNTIRSMKSPSGIVAYAVGHNQWWSLGLIIRDRDRELPIWDRDHPFRDQDL